MGPFAQYLWEVLSVVSSHISCGFCETSKTRNNTGTTVRFLTEKKIRPQTLKCSWRKLTRNAWTLKWRFLKVHVDPSYLHINYVLWWSKVLRHFVWNKGGGTRNENGGAGRSRWDRSVGTLLGVCTLQLLSIEDGTSLGIRPMCGFQVIDPTVAWILSHVGPTIRRGHRFVSFCTNVVECIPWLLAVVVSLNNFATPPLLHISDKKSYYCCTGIWYVEVNSTCIIKPNPKHTPRI